jgi:hypothetical protein
MLRSTLFSPNASNRAVFSLFGLCALFYCCCIPLPRRDSTGGPARLFSDSSLVAIYIPLEKIKIFLVDESHSSLPASLNDTFFIEVANALAQYEVSRHFNLLHFTLPDTVDTVQKFCAPDRQKALRSLMVADNGSREKMIAAVRSVAAQCSVDLLIFPVLCSIRETVSQQSGWRNDKYGKSYERPATCVAEALFHVQIWNKNGKKVYEYKSLGISKQPVFYSLFKQEKPKNENLVKYSKSLFAPPLIRALGEAVKKAFTAKSVYGSQPEWR